MDAVYRIRVKGHLDDRWSEALGGMTLIRECDGSTLLIGPAMDQAALHGLIERIRDLGVPLLSVVRNADAHGESGATDSVASSKEEQRGRFE